MTDGVKYIVNDRVINNLLSKLDFTNKKIIKALKTAIKRAGGLALEEIVETITYDIEPHMRRGQLVTDLVDTGQYRAAWQQIISDEGLSTKVLNNVIYAAILEYGFEGVVSVSPHTRKTPSGAKKPVVAHKRLVKRPAYAPVRKTLPKIRELFIEELRRQIGKAVNDSLK